MTYIIDNSPLCIINTDFIIRLSYTIVIFLITKRNSYINKVLRNIKSLLSIIANYKRNAMTCLFHVSQLTEYLLKFGINRLTWSANCSPLF